MTTWYREGLVTLTAGSDLVAGVGTEWVDNVLPGGIFFTPTGLVEVERVISDGSLKLVTPYSGPSASGAEYAIAPTQGYVTALSREVNALLGDFGELKDAWQEGSLNGKGLALKGVKNTVGELPSTGNTQGDGWLVGGVLYVWSGVAWVDQGAMVTTPELEALRDAAGVSAGVAVGSALAAEATRSAFEDRVYPGVYTTPPTNKPHSGAVSAEGDRCTILVGGVAYEHLRTGGGWLIPNVDAASLALSTGAARVGTPEGTLQTALDARVKAAALSAPTGALQVNKSGDSISNILDRGTRLRGLRATMDALEPMNRLPKTCVLKKLRSDQGATPYLEFVVYAPMTADGVHWSRWYFTNRLNNDNAGSAGMKRLSDALLYQSSIQAPAAENLTTGAESQGPTASQVTAAATRVGTWSAAATVGGVTDVTYSTTIGDTATYSITGVARLGLRSYVNSGNGGVVAITIKEAGVEIAEANYRVPLTVPSVARTVDMKALGAGLYFVPIADGLDPAKTYVVEIAVAPTNPAGGRAYDAGLRGYAATAFNAAGRAAGTWFTQVFGAAPTVGSYLSGCKVVYQCASVTKINWKFVTSPNSGKVKFKVFDSVGAEIAAGKYVNATYDCYLGANNLVTVPVAAGLTPGTYYLVVETDTAKNAASTAYRVYDAGVASYNESVGGVLGVDSFDDQGLVGLSVEGKSTLIGTGNLELAIKLRKPTDALSDAEFVGGVHGHETNPTGLIMRADGAAIDYTALAVGGTVMATTFDWSYSTTLRFKSDNSQAGTAFYTGAVSPGGYAFSAIPVLTAPCIVHAWYCYMFNVPNSKVGTEGIAGGFEKAAIEGAWNLFPTAGNDTLTQMAQQVSGMVVWNREYAAYGFQTNIAEVSEIAKGLALNPLISGGLPDSRSILADRSDQKFKLYSRAFTGNESAGILLPAGFSLPMRGVYRGFRASGLDVVLG